MATVDVDRLIPITEAPNFLKPVRGRTLCPDTVKRWATRGFRCGTKLWCLKVGGRWLLDLDELRRFVETTNCAQMID